MTIQRRAFRIAVIHFIVSFFCLYILVAFEIPGKSMPLAGAIFGTVWGVLNPPVFMIRKAMELYSGLALAFYAVFLLQVCMSVALYLGILWIHDLRTRSSKS